MAQPYNLDTIYLDGIELKDALCSINIKSYDFKHDTLRPNISIEIKGPHYTMTFTPEAMERVIERGHTTFYFYGILPKLLPDLYKDKTLLPWQLAYLRVRDNHTLLDEFKYQRNDVIFSRLHAVWFEKGWEANGK